MIIQAGVFAESSLGGSVYQSYIVLYIVQVGFQVSFQMEQDVGHVESDL